MPFGCHRFFDDDHLNLRIEINFNGFKSLAIFFESSNVLLLYFPKECGFLRKHSKP
jgi:hypothetical protein